MKRVSLKKYTPPKRRLIFKIYLQIWKLTQFFLFNIPIDGFNSLRIFLLRVFGASIGEDVIVRPFSRFYNPKNLIVKNNVWIGEHVWIYNYDLVTLHQDSVLSQEVIICTASHNYKSQYFETVSEPIEVGPGSWLCIRSIVLQGAKIAENEIIPANTVVGK